MGKGEIPRYEQFLFFLQYFQKTCTDNRYTPGLFWERVKNILFLQDFENLKATALQKF